MLMAFVQQTAGVMEGQNCSTLRKVWQDAFFSSTLSPSESPVDLKLLNQNVSHFALALALLPRQLTNCGENILLA